MGGQVRGDAQNGARLDAKNGTTPDAEYEAQPVAGPVVGRGPQCDADNTSGSRSRAAARRKKRRVPARRKKRRVCHGVRKEGRRYRRSLRREARAREREALKQLPKRERLHAWWRTRPLGVTFTVYLAVYLAAATLLALGMVEVLSTWNNGYYELEVHAWWRTRPLGVTFTVYLAVYLAAATLLALGMVEVLSTWNNGYYELEVSLENGLTQRVEQRVLRTRGEPRKRPDPARNNRFGPVYLRPQRG